MQIIKCVITSILSEIDAFKTSDRIFEGVNALRGLATGKMSTGLGVVGKIFTCCADRTGHAFVAAFRSGTLDFVVQVDASVPSRLQCPGLFLRTVRLELDVLLIDVDAKLLWTELTVVVELRTVERGRGLSVDAKLPVLDGVVTDVAGSRRLRVGVDSLAVDRLELLRRGFSVVVAGLLWRGLELVETELFWSGFARLLWWVVSVVVKVRLVEVGLLWRVVEVGLLWVVVEVGLLWGVVVARLIWRGLGFAETVGGLGVAEGFWSGLIVVASGALWGVEDGLFWKGLAITASGALWAVVDWLLWRGLGVTKTGLWRGLGVAKTGLWRGLTVVASGALWAVVLWAVVDGLLGILVVGPRPGAGLTTVELTSKVWGLARLLKFWILLIGSWNSIWTSSSSTFDVLLNP